MVEKNVFLDVIGYNPRTKILDVLITGRKLDYSATGIIRAADIGRATFYDVFPQLLKQGLVLFTQKIGNIQLYTINQKSLVVQQLIKLHNLVLREVLEKYEEETKTVETVQEVIRGSTGGKSRVKARVLEVLE